MSTDAAGAPLSQLGALGPFFEVNVATASVGAQAPWQPLAQLLQPAGVRARISRVRTALATTVRTGPAEVPWRVAASVAHLGLAARLLSPCLGALTLGLGTLVLHPEATWWQPVIGGPVPLRVSADALDRAGSGGLDVAEGILGTLTDLFRAESVSSQVLWGNVASASNGAYRALIAVRPDLTDQARTYVQDALHRPMLWGRSNGQVGPPFRRTNCCLIYRLAPQGSGRDGRQVCGDCVLRNP